MKKVCKVISSVMFIVWLMTMPVLANNLTWESVPGHHNLSILLPRNEKSSSDTVQRNARGEILSTGIVEITNEKNGDIYIRISTYAHRNVDRIHHAVYLDQWNEERADWEQVDYWDFAKAKEEEENGQISSMVTSFTLSGYPVNRYYRVRGLHAVELGNEIEGCASETNGVYITDH